eukprot:g19904.t1
MGCKYDSVAVPDRQSIPGVSGESDVARVDRKRSGAKTNAGDASTAKKRRFDRKADTAAGAGSEEAGAAASDGVVTLDHVLQNLDPDAPESVETLVKEFNDKQHAERTKTAQNNAITKYFEPICAKLRWDPTERLSCDKIRTLAAVLEKVSSIKKSRHIVLANIKGKLTASQPLSDAEQKEYSRCFARLQKGVVATQEHPALLSFWEKADVIKSGGSPYAVTKKTVVDLGLWLDFAVTVWFLLQRPDELKDLQRKRYKNGGEECVRIHLRRAKRDQEARGFDARFRCCCGDVSKLKLKRKICPVHAVDDATWEAYATMSAAHHRKMMAEVIRRLGMEERDESGRSLWNLYSFRIGGACAARQGKLSREETCILGRWKNVKTEMRYEGDRSINVSERHALKWPLVSAVLLGSES